jgi:hypothetical protein
MNSTIRSLLNSIIDGVRESFGQPVTLQRALAQHPQMCAQLTPQAPCIDAESVVQWHELGKPSPFRWPRRECGDLRGWKGTTGHDYRSFNINRPEYAQLGHLEIIDNWTCDISQLHGFAASKSDLRKFTTTDAMVAMNSQEMISEISHAKLAKNLAHDEIRILHRDKPNDHFALYQWDGRLWLMNSGGSHHLASAKYIAARLGVAVPLRAKLYIYSLNPAAIESLRRDFELFVVSADPAASNAFHDAMRAFCATWLWHDMPRPYDDMRAILLPKSELRAMRVAEELRKVGVFDLGAFLATLAASQLRKVMPAERAARPRVPKSAVGQRDSA